MDDFYEYQEFVNKGEANHSPQRETNKNYLQIKSHGTKAAVNVTPVESRSTWHTIAIEGAKKLDGGGKAFNWKNKLVIQVTQAELPVVTATLLGHLPSCTYGNHGDKNKRFVIENQGGNFFFKIMQQQPNDYIATQVTLTEATMMGTIALTQYAKNFPGLSADAALGIIKHMAVSMYNNNSFPKAQEKKVKV